MKRFWMHGKTHPLPLTAAAVSLLLVACGGGGSDDTAVSASPSTTPGATSTTTTVNINTPGTGSTSTTGSSASSTTTDNASGSNSGSTGQGATQASDSNTAGAGNADGDAQNPGTALQTDTTGNTAEATPPAPVPAVSTQGVRADVLLAMFDQHGCLNEYDMQRTDAETTDTPPVSATALLDTNPYTYDYNAWYQNGRSMPSRVPTYYLNCAYPDIRSYSNPLKPGAYSFQMITEGRYHTYFTMRYYGDPSITRGVNASRTRYTLAVTDTQFSLGGRVTVQLAQDFGYKATSIAGNDVPPGQKYELRYSGPAVSFQRQALVPFGTLNQWQIGPDHTLRLMLIHAGDEGANVVRLCTNLNSHLAKRLHCVTWQVPENWVWGQELVGGRHYLIDDRSVYPNESGFLYWNVQPPAN